MNVLQGQPIIESVRPNFVFLTTQRVQVVSHSVVSNSLDPMDWSLPGSSVHGISQATLLEWVAIPFSRGSSQPRDQTQVSCIAGRFFTIWATREASLMTDATVKHANGGGGLVAKSCLTLVTPWTRACQAPLSMGFSRQEYWSGLPLPSPGDLPDPGIELRSPALQADSLPTELWGKPKHANTYPEKRANKYIILEYYCSNPVDTVKKKNYQNLVA